VASVAYRFNIFLNILYWGFMSFVLLIFVSPVVGYFAVSAFHINIDLIDAIEGIPLWLLLFWGIERIAWGFFFSGFPKSVYVDENKIYFHYFFKYQTASVDRSKIKLHRRQEHVYQDFVLRRGIWKNVYINEINYKYDHEDFPTLFR
jgi:hypothetical protein